MCGGILSGILGGLLALPTFHLGFLQKPSLLCKTSPFFTVFDLVLPDKRFWGVTKYALVFTKLADPDVFGVRRMVKVGILLLNLPLPCG